MPASFLTPVPLADGSSATAESTFTLRALDGSHGLRMRPEANAQPKGTPGHGNAVVAGRTGDELQGQLAVLDAPPEESSPTLKRRRLQVDAQTAPGGSRQIQAGAGVPALLPNAARHAPASELDDSTRRVSPRPLRSPSGGQHQAKELPGLAATDALQAGSLSPALNAAAAAVAGAEDVTTVLVPSRKEATVGKDRAQPAAWVGGRSVADGTLVHAAAGSRLNSLVKACAVDTELLAPEAATVGTATPHAIAPAGSSSPTSAVANGGANVAPQMPQLPRAHPPMSPQPGGAVGRATSATPNIGPTTALTVHDPSPASASAGSTEEAHEAGVAPSAPTLLPPSLWLSQCSQPPQALLALTIQQPFASAILDNYKKVENRSFAPPRLGPSGMWIAVHAGASVASSADSPIIAAALAALRRAWPAMRAAETYPSSAVLGLMHVRDVVSVQRCDGDPQARARRGSLGSASLGFPGRTCRWPRAPVPCMPSTLPLGVTSDQGRLCLGLRRRVADGAPHLAVGSWVPTAQPARLVFHPSTWPPLLPRAQAIGPKCWRVDAVYKLPTPMRNVRGAQGLWNAPGALASKLDVPCITSQSSPAGTRLSRPLPRA